MFTSFNFRSIPFFTKTMFAKTVSTLALGVVLSSLSVFAQANQANASSNTSSANASTSVSANTFDKANGEAAESFVSASELVQNEVNFTPARADMAAIKKSVQYPESALKNSITGRFDLIVYLNKTGDINTINFVTDRPENNSMNAIIAAACEAVKKSRFTPATLNNKPISSSVRIPFSFIM
jgi:TonB family protein